MLLGRGTSRRALESSRLETSRVEPRGATSEQVMTVGEVASYLRVTSKTVYELIRRGALPSFRIGRAVPCRRHDIEQFIADQTAVCERPHSPYAATASAEETGR